MIRKTAAVLTVLTALAVAATAYALTRRPDPGESVEVTVPAGASTVQIAELLVENEVIGSTAGFRLMSRLRGLDGTIRAGRYELRKGLGVQAALDALASGPRDRLSSITIPEGYTVAQIARRVGERTHITEEAFLEVATSGRIRASIQPQGVESLEGFLFPETYSLSEHDTAEQLVRRMVDQFEAHAADLDWTRAEAAGLTKYEAVTLASLIEREAKLDEDRAMVSAVIYNRLRKGMRLQIDITALYDAPRHKIPTRRDLQRESPYNTYLN
ncbi:MAG TPA: endolytic transglycosylase MltG, partial [Actinomycetota bacterium]|nr:endolytic transglycosylase MltG [Actinomycetota bacterium]